MMGLVQRLRRASWGRWFGYAGLFAGTLGTFFLLMPDVVETAPVTWYWFAASLCVVAVFAVLVGFGFGIGLALIGDALQPEFMMQTRPDSPVKELECPHCGGTHPYDEAYLHPDRAPCQQEDASMPDGELTFTWEEAEEKGREFFIELNDEEYKKVRIKSECPDCGSVNTVAPCGIMLRDHGHYVEYCGCNLTRTGGWVSDGHGTPFRG